jgi:hypothetical protein
LRIGGRVLVVVGEARRGCGNACAPDLPLERGGIADTGNRQRGLPR